MTTFWKRFIGICRSSPTVAAIVVFSLALVARSIIGTFVSQPGYADSYYYFLVAENLYRGRGFVEDYIWNYIEGTSTITHPSNAYWMPLSSIAMAASSHMFGFSFRAAQVPMILASSLLPAIGYYISTDREQLVIASSHISWMLAANTADLLHKR